MFFFLNERPFQGSILRKKKIPKLLEMTSLWPKISRVARENINKDIRPSQGIAYWCTGQFKWVMNILSASLCYSIKKKSLQLHLEWHR